jgi:hypothetical protein
LIYRNLKGEEETMADTKYGKYIITDVKTDIFLSPGEKMLEGDDSIIANLDDSIIKGAFLMQACWQRPQDFIDDEPVQPHSHDFDEVLCQFGMDPNNPHDLGGELEIWLGGEKHIVTKSCIVYIPKGLVHGPIKYNRIDRPIFHFACGNGKVYK